MDIPLMSMSGDFEITIEEEVQLVRIRAAMIGDREYPTIIIGIKN